MSIETTITTNEAPATTTETATSEPAQQDERATLIAAVEAATKGEEPKPESVKQDAAAKAPAAELKESKVAAVLRAREEAQAARNERESVKAETERARAELASLRAEAERANAEAKAELERVRKLRSAPLEAIKELGWDPKQLVDEVVREGTPEWQAQKRYEAMLEQQRAELAELKAWREDQKKSVEQQTEAQRAYARQQVEKQFLASFPSESVAKALYDERDLVAKAHAIADAYREKSGGKVASIEEVRDYIEEQAVKRLAAVRHQSSVDTSSQAPALAAKVATQPKANGPRALSGNVASERRTSPKPRHEWSPDEEYSALKAAAEAAMK
jgi:hypothetical protein